MERLYSPKRLKEVLEKFDFSFSKGLGQNFLIDGNILRKISELADLDKTDRVLEIGTGIGTLTEELCIKAGSVLAVEIDKTLEPILKETLPYENLKIVFDDILKIDLKGLIEENFGNQSFKIIANLPYYITSPIISMLIKSGLKIESITCMIQRELALRMVEEKGGKNYSSYSVFIQAFTEPKLGVRVPPSVFMPRPKVESQVISLKLKDRGQDQEFERIVRGAFAQRRKTLVNSLNATCKDFSKEKIISALKSLGKEENIRAQDMDYKEFEKLRELLLIK
ncbi:dimethyladenosine transferase [Clostridiales bacterium KA00134]|nr:dimethyladenosine transferase [Clostridiales bacterium KA00134]